MRKLTILAAAWLAGCSVAASAAPATNPPGRYAPRELCTRLPGATAFRAALASAIGHRDAASLAGMASAKVQLDFGGGEGRNELRRRLAGPQTAALWHELDALTRLGCDVDRGVMVLPWFFNQDLGDLDEMDVWLVAGAEVPLYEVPDRKARTLAHLSWQLVAPVAGFREQDAFQQVDLVGMRRRGFVETARLRSHMGYRMTVARSGGKWQITAFVAGD